jgi:hypothetical protein
MVSQIGQWAGHLAVAALAATLDRPGTILHKQGQVYRYNPDGSNREVYLYSGDHHYECLDVDYEDCLALHTKAMPGKTTGGREAERGGGKRSPSSPAASVSARSLGGLIARSAAKGKPIPFSPSKILKRPRSQDGRTVNQHDRMSFSPGGQTQVISIGGKIRVSLKPSVGGRTRKSNCDKGGNNGPVEPSDAGSRDELASLGGCTVSSRREVQTGTHDKPSKNRQNLESEHECTVLSFV